MGQLNLSWTEMKKARYHVVLRVFLDGHVVYVHRGIKRRKRRRQFLHKGQSVLCHCVPAMHVVFDYLNIIALRQNVVSFCV